jgi:hypothetical protein
MDGMRLLNGGLPMQLQVFVMDIVWIDTEEVVVDHGNSRLIAACWDMVSPDHAK